MRSETKTKKAARADQVVDGFMKYGGEGMLTTMVVLNSGIMIKRVHA